MTSQQCWRPAKSCHDTEASGSCQAWYRCEAAGDYVIKWQCHPSAGGDGHNVTAATSSFFLCNDQQQSDCPPPVVCASEDNGQTTNDMSNDLILAIVLATFAVLAIMLIMATTYKYCMIRKSRHRRPLHQRPYVYPYPVRYHNLWGTSPQLYNAFGKKTSSTPLYPGHFQDVYFSRPYESSRKFEHLLSSSDDSIEFPASKFRSGPLPPFAGKPKTDPSVVTGSFVFHQPGSSGIVSNQSGKERPYATKREPKDGGSDETPECYHIYRGNLSRFPHPDHVGQLPRGHLAKKDLLPDISAEFLPFPRLSSIAVPGYGQHPESHKRGRSHEKFSRHSFDSSSSRDSISPYASSGLDQTPATHHQPHHHHHHHRNKRSHRGSPHSNSPDVITSHNFSNLVKVGLNLYRSIQGRAHSLASLTSSDLQDHHRKISKRPKGHHVIDNTAELSYDSFRNEHLKDVATKGAASSSTLEAGFRHKSHDVETPTHSRY